VANNPAPFIVRQALEAEVGPLHVLRDPAPGAPCMLLRFLDVEREARVKQLAMQHGPLFFLPYCMFVATSSKKNESYRSEQIKKV
jgi:hypothetical protein